MLIEISSRLDSRIRKTINLIITTLDRFCILSRITCYLFQAKILLFCTAGHASSEIPCLCSFISLDMVPKSNRVQENMYQNSTKMSQTYFRMLFGRHYKKRAIYWHNIPSSFCHYLLITNEKWLSWPFSSITKITDELPSIIIISDIVPNGSIFICGVLLADSTFLSVTNTDEVPMRILTVGNKYRRPILTVRQSVIDSKKLPTAFLSEFRQ